MTSKQYKHISRVKVTKLSKFSTYLSLMIFFYFSYSYDLSGYLVAGVSTTLWLYVPDIVAYLLESFYHIEHDHISYR